jgi:hypothetical protein
MVHNYQKKDTTNITSVFLSPLKAKLLHRDPATLHDTFTSHSNLYHPGEVDPGRQNILCLEASCGAICGAYVRYCTRRLVDVFSYTKMAEIIVFRFMGPSCNLISGYRGFGQEILPPSSNCL